MEINVRKLQSNLSTRQSRADDSQSESQTIAVYNSVKDIYKDVRGKALYTIMLCDCYQYEEFKNNFFNFEYPFYKEERRKEFEAAFIRHFYLREIGFETISEFLLNMQVVFQETIEFYNKLMELAEKEYNPLLNYDLTEIMDSKENQNGTKNQELERTVVGHETDNVQTSSTNTQTGTSEDTETKEGNTVKDGTGSLDISKLETKDTTNKDITNDTIDKTGNRTEDNSSTIDTDNTIDTQQKETTNNTSWHSDTPQGSIQDLKSKSYATYADIEEDEKTIKNTGTTTESNDKTEQIRNNYAENIDNNITKNTTGSDIVDVTEGHDTTNKETTTQNDSSNLTGNINNTTTEERTDSNNKTSNSNADETINSVEDKNKKLNYTLTRRGNIGVQTSAQILNLEIELRKKLTNIWKLFFETECDILFMQVF